MRFVSTGGQSPAVDLRTALTQGLAPDGGLYLPERMDPVDATVLAGLHGQSFSVVSRAVARHLLGSVIPSDDLDRIVDVALNFEVPLVALSDVGSESDGGSMGADGSMDDLYLLELFHGPTLAFKDVGARFMARLMSHYRRPTDPERTVLVATSGDTGAAVAHAFLGLEGFRMMRSNVGSDKGYAAQ